MAPHRSGLSLLLLGVVSLTLGGVGAAAAEEPYDIHLHTIVEEVKMDLTAGPFPALLHFLSST